MWDIKKPCKSEKTSTVFERNFNAGMNSNNATSLSNKAKDEFKRCWKKLLLDTAKEISQKTQLRCLLMSRGQSWLYTTDQLSQCYESRVVFQQFCLQTCFNIFMM